jgi:hypothetical protein
VSVLLLLLRKVVKNGVRVPEVIRVIVVIVVSAATVVNAATEVIGAEMMTEAKVAAKVVAEMATAMPRKSPSIWR